MKSHSFTIYNASAGSGKTFTLAKEYLKILFLSPNDDAYKRILAITFTNKAVEEMKSRILNSLLAFSKDEVDEDFQDLFEAIHVETSLSFATIRDKSKAIVKNIIHNYSSFGISTIDKFTLKVIRSFAQDLNLPSNFEVTLDTKALLQEAVDLVISRVGEDEELTSFLVDFSKTKTDEDKNWDISYELYEIAELLTKEIHAKEVNQLDGKTFNDFVEVRLKLKHQKEALENEIIEIGLKSLKLIEANCVINSFYRSLVPNFLQKIASGNLSINTTVVKYLDGESSRYSKTTSAADKNWIDDNAIYILDQILKINELVGKLYFYSAFQKNITPLSLLNTINKEYKKIQEEQNTLSIADFNKIISDEIQDQPSPFIYEKLGDKYRHFFIDEFQDTSEMQWNNLIPLIDNALSSEDNGIKGSLMLVGDPKQSIYRWRGGKAEQFIELSKTQNPFSNKDKLVENLKTNYRSFSEVIDFNNKFFHHLANQFENLDYQKLYKETSIQEENNRKGGYVNLSFISTENEEFYDAEEEDLSYKNKLYLEKTLETIEKCLENGFQLGEIVLLTRAKREGVLLANFLTEKNIQILTSEALMLQNATEVRLLISALRFLNNPNDLESKAMILYFVAKYFQKELPVHDFIVHNLRLTEAETEANFKNLGISISFKTCRTKSLYEVVEILINAFLKEKSNNSYVQYFLDLVLERDAKNKSSVADFIDYWDKIGFEKSIPSPEGTNAIRIMTIHKSKGLEFPVVIYPFAEEDFSRNKSDKIWIDFEESNEFDLPKALVNKNKDVINYGESAQLVFEKVDQEQKFDTINVLYVALTRAKEQLYIISNKIVSKKGVINEKNLSYYFLEYLMSVNKFNDNILEYEFGSSKRISIYKTKESLQQNILNVENKLEFNQIKIAQKEALLWGTAQQEAINYGNTLHEIMALIYSKNDVEVALEKNIENGVITINESKAFRNTIQEIVNHPELESFFDGKNKVLNEQLILDSEFGNLKPDKIVIQGNNVLILDYKTGEFSDNHKKQLEKYALTLQKMNFKVIKKVLVYTNQSIQVVLL